MARRSAARCTGSGDVIWRFGAFQLDDTRYVLTRDGAPVELRPKTFDVLVHLVVHAGRVVTKRELLERAWPGETVTDAVLPHNVAALRKALGDSRSAARMIETVHGRGYRFVASVTREGPSHAGASTPVAGGGRGAFVGREPVMATLVELLDRSRAGRGRAALLIGEAGIGKTRTAEELADLAAARDVRVLIGRCHEGEGAPAYWPWSQILRGLTRDDPIARGQAEGAGLDELLGRPLPEKRVSPTTAESAEARFRLFDAVTRLLSDAASRSPLLVVLDDLQWADEASLRLTAFAAAEGRQSPLLLLGTTRPADTDPQRSHTGLLDDSAIERIYLDGLSDTSVEALVRELGRADLDHGAVRELRDLSRGNPFFLRELLQLLPGEPGAARSAGLPPRVVEVIALRLRSLGEPCVSLLRRAAVVGREFSLGVLEAIGEAPRERLVELLGIASDARIVEPPDESPPGRYRFSHDLIAEALYAQLPDGERRALHARIAGALEALYGADAAAHASELAHHHGRAAPLTLERAIHFSQLAGKRAEGLLAFEDAQAHYRRALGLLELSLPVDEEVRFELKLALGGALFRGGSDGTPTLLEAAEIARGLDSAERLGRVVMAMVGWPRVTVRARTANRALPPLLAEAVARGDAMTPALRARLSSAASLNAPPRTPHGERAEHARRALGLARAAGSAEALHDGLYAAMQLADAPEQLEQRAALADELLAVAKRLGDADRIFTAHEQCIFPRIATFDLPAADAHLTACRELSERLRLPRCRIQVLRLSLQRALGDGRFDDVDRLTEEVARVRGRANATNGYLAGLFTWLFFKQALQGRTAWFDRDGITRLAQQSTMMRSHVAFMFASLGEHDTAREQYRQVLAPEHLDARQGIDWLFTYGLVAQAVIDGADADAARVLYPRLAPHAARNQSHADLWVYLGSCRRLVGGLAALLGRREEALAQLEQAEHDDRRIGARPAVAQSQLARGRLLLQAVGHGGVAARAEGESLVQRALATGEALGMAPLCDRARVLLGRDR